MMQYYYVYNKHEQLQQCVAQLLKQIDNEVRLVAIHDNEGQQRLMDFLNTDKSHIFLLPLVITVRENKRSVLSTQQMYEWVSTKCQDAEKLLGSKKYGEVKQQCVKSNIHPVVLAILSNGQTPIGSDIARHDESRPLAKVESHTVSSSNDENIAAHWDTYSSVTTTPKDATSRVSITDALQNGKQREVGVSPMAQATRR